MTMSNRTRAAMKQRNIGLDAKAPAAQCKDDKCPWHGNLPVRGQTFTGKVSTARSARTATVEWGFTVWLPKFERFERRHSHVVVHNPACIEAKAGDMVRIAECRPLSKTKKFVIVEKTGESQ